MQTDLLQRALADERRGRWEDARRHYRRALVARPDDEQALYLLGDLERRLGEQRAAIDCLGRAATLAPGRADILETFGRALAVAGNTDAARDAYTRALAADPDYARTYVSLGDLWRRKGFVAEAERHYRQASACDPTQAHAQLGLGRLLRDQGHWERAEQAFRDALTLAPTLYAARVALARLCNQRRRFDAARDLFEQCRDAQCPDPRIATGLAYACLQLGRYDEASQALDEALRRNPDAANAMALRGRLNLALGNPDAAARAYDAALERAPRLRLARLGRIAVQAARGDYAGALAQFDRLETGARGDLDVSLLHARLLLGAGHARAAALLVQNLSARMQAGEPPGDRDRFAIHLALGQVAEEMGDLRKAWQAFGVANACLPRRYDALATRKTADAVQALFTAHPALPAARGAPFTPLLIVGLPASGAGVLAAALTAHPDAETVVPTVSPAQLASTLAGRFGSAATYPACLRDCRRGELERLAREVWPGAFADSGAKVRVLAAGDDEDIHLGLYLALFANLRVIRCTRERGDHELACYRHDYSGPPRDFSLHWDDVADRLRVHDMMMRFWRGSGVRMLECRREALMARPVDALGRVLAFAGLDYRARCLAHVSPRTYAPAAGFHTPLRDPSIGRRARYDAALGGLG